MLTEPEDSPEPAGRKLRRTYAVENLMPTPVPKGKYEKMAVEEVYAPSTEHESDAAVELSEVDDDPTPKKKQKTVKVSVREAVASSRQQPVSRQEERKVSRLMNADVLI